MPTPPSSPTPPIPPIQPPGQTPSLKPPTAPAAAYPPSSSASTPEQTTSWEDPTGVSTKFLSTGGSQATPEQVQSFLSTLLKFFSKVILQESEEAAKRSAKQMKDAIEGRD